MSDRTDEIRPDQMTKDQLRRTVKRNRARVAADVDALGTKLEPGHLEEEVKNAARDKKDEVTARAKRRVRDAGEGISDEIRDNPLPYALMGAGATWLVLDRISKRSARVQRARQRVRRAAREAGSEGRIDDLKGRARDRWDDLEGQARGNWDDVKSKARIRADDVRIAAEQARDRGGVVARDAAGRAEGVFMDRPLLIGGAAFAAGVGLALALPMTDRERERFGDLSASLQAQARGLSREMAEEARAAATQAATEAKHHARDAVEDLEDIAKSSAEEMGERVKTAAHEAKAMPSASSPSSPQARTTRSEPDDGNGAASSRWS